MNGVKIYNESTYLAEPLKNLRSYCLNGQINYTKYKDSTQKRLSNEFFPSF